ncbi:MAG: muconolactone Delta-isomerase family protein [Mycobacterium sp.]
MATFMVVGAFSPETDLPLMSSVLAEEVAQVKALQSEGRLGSVHISPARGRVFLEVIAEDEAATNATVQTLPMAKWWTVEVYPTVGPPPSNAGAD